MPVIQVEYFVPEEDYIQILAQNWKPLGLPIHNGQHIIKYIQPVSSAIKASSKKAIAPTVKKVTPVLTNRLSPLLKQLSQHKYIVIGTAAGAAVVSIVTYLSTHKKPSANQLLQDEFNNAVTNYFNAVATGNLTLTILSELIHQVNLAQANPKIYKISKTQASALAAQIRAYTIQLSQANPSKDIVFAINPSTFDQPWLNCTDDLNYQQQLFKLL